MLAALHSSLSKVGMRVTMRAHNDQINRLVAEERVGIAVMLHVGIVHSAVLALWCC